LADISDIKGKSEFLPLTLLGVNGLTAWAGVFREMNLKPEHTLLVSGAAGSVGTCLVQLAKHVIGCKRVVGIAGGKEKCDWVKSLGADECVDYKSASFAKDLAAALPDETDFFFDNVGGEVLNEALTRVKRYGHITVCGAISGGSCIDLADVRLPRQAAAAHQLARGRVQPVHP
jgi:NADPH-dependent curcumin reductase CurA